MIVASAPLAILGGEPAFGEKLHVGRPNIGNVEAFFARARQIFDRRWFTNNGKMVQEFEATAAKRLGVKHCVAMCNATVALEIAIRALDLRGEVIVPSFTFIATAHALQWQEITPVFCDVDPATHNLDPACIERLITPRTTGIIGVHVWGRACAIEELEAVAERHRLQLMFDASHAFGCSHRGKMIGNFGRAEVFSFHATKFLNTFEGGIVATNDDDLAAKMRLMKNFGFAGLDRVDYIGTNGKMDEMSAAMGLTGLESMDDFIAVNREHYQRYRAGLSAIPGITFSEYDEFERCNYQYIVFEVDPDRFGLCRDELIRVLQAENILARRYFHPGCHRQMPYRAFYPNAGMLLPETEALCDRIAALPTGTAISGTDVDRIVGIVQRAHTEASGVRAALQAAAA